jgi:sec-independent protein translocase protein TatC
MFINPALTRQEKKYLYMLMPAAVIFFFAGATFTYFIFLPRALEFLLNFPLLDSAEPYISLGNYISVSIKLLFVMGLVFELPIFIYFFTKLGIITPQWLSKYRRFAIVGAFIVAAIVTPTFDPINQLILAIPIMLLYEIGILLSKLAYRGKKAPY